MRSLLVVLVLVLAGVSSAQAQAVRLGEQRVEQREARVVVTWRTDTEVGVQGYEVMRRSAATGDQYRSLGSVAAHGAGRAYEFVDDDLYKNTSSMADYQVVAVLAGGGRQLLFGAQINYTTTGLRRTWGSLKAMFQ